MIQLMLYKANYGGFFFFFPDWASLIVQLVKSLPAIQETSVRFLGWEDRLEKG